MFNALNSGRTALRFNVLFLVIPLLFILVSPAPDIQAAQESGQESGWQFDGWLYMWGASFGGKTANGDTIDISFNDVLNNLDFAFMGGGEARNGRWSVTTDVIYMKVKAENGNTVTEPAQPGGPDVVTETSATVKLRGWVVTPAVGYCIFDNGKLSTDVIAGARYLWLRSGLDYETTDPTQSNKSVSTSGSVWDGIVGVRGKVNLNRRLYVPYYADMGTGDSAFTWQTMIGVSYQISKVIDVVAAYRYLYWKFEDNELIDRLDFTGPLVGLKFRF